MFYFLVCVFCLSYFLRQALLFSLGRPGIHDLAHAALSSWQLFCLSLLNPVIMVVELQNLDTKCIIRPTTKISDILNLAHSTILGNGHFRFPQLLIHNMFHSQT